MRLAENESRLVGMKFEALVELSRKAEGIISKSLLCGFIPVIPLKNFVEYTRDSRSLQIIL
jgi:hypothetical protein